MHQNKLFAGFLTLLLTISLAGCGNTTQIAEKESSNPAPQTIQTADVISDAEPSDGVIAEESTLESAAANSESIPAQALEPIDTAAPTEPIPEKSHKASQPPAQSEQSGEIPEPRQPETTKPEEPKTTQPVQSQTPAPAEPKPPVEQPSEEPKEPEFDIEYWISFAKDYAQSIGLELDSEAVNCWDTPITAGAHRIYLERDMQSRLNRYSRDEDITAVWIWAEKRADGNYDFYIGYA